MKNITKIELKELLEKYIENSEIEDLEYLKLLSESNEFEINGKLKKKIKYKGKELNKIFCKKIPGSISIEMQTKFSSNQSKAIDVKSSNGDNIYLI